MRTPRVLKSLVLDVACGETGNALCVVYRLLVNNSSFDGANRRVLQD